MFDLKNEFEAAMQNDGLTFESGVNFLANAEDVISAVIADANQQEYLMTFESALNDLTKFQLGFDAVAAIEETVKHAQASMDNGTVSYETAVAVSANIEKELGKLNAKMDDYMDEAISLESAHDHPSETVRRIVAAFTADDITFEAADDKSMTDKAKEAIEKGKTYAITKYKQFKAWLIKMYKKVVNLLKDAYLKVVNFISTDAKTIDRLIAECASLSGKVREGKKLTVADFKGSFPYLADHTNSQLDALTGRWAQDGDAMVALGQDLISFAFENGYSAASMEEVTKRVQTNIISKMKDIPGTNKKGIILVYPGIEIKALVADAANLFKVESFKGKEQPLTKAIKPLSVAEIKSNLESLKAENNKVVKVLKKFPDALKKLEGAAPKESIGFKYISAGTNAISQYSNGSIKTIKAFIALNAKHMSVYERN